MLTNKSREIVLGENFLLKFSREENKGFPLFMFLSPTEFQKSFLKLEFFLWIQFGHHSPSPPSHSWNQLQYLWVGWSLLPSCWISKEAVVKWCSVSYKEDKHGISGAIPEIRFREYQKFNPGCSCGLEAHYCWKPGHPFHSFFTNIY